MYQPYPGSETQLPPAQRASAPASVRNAAVTFLWRPGSTAFFREARA